MSLRFNRKIFIFCISLLLFSFNTISVFAIDIVEGSLWVSDKVCVAPFVLSEFCGNVAKNLGYSMKDDVNGSIVQHAIGEKLVSEGAFYIDSSIDAQNNIRNTLRLTSEGWNSLKKYIFGEYYNPPNKIVGDNGVILTYIYNSEPAESIQLISTVLCKKFQYGRNSDFYLDRSIWDGSYGVLAYRYSENWGTQLHIVNPDTYEILASQTLTSDYSRYYGPISYKTIECYDESVEPSYPSPEYSNVSNFGYPVSVNSNKDGSYYLTNDKTVNDDYVVPSSSGTVFNNIDESVTYIVNNYPSSIIPSNTGDNGNTGGNTDSGDGTLGDNANKGDSYIDDLEFPTENKPGEGSSVLDWLMYWVQSIINFVLSLLKMLLKVFTSLFDFLKSLIDITSELASIWNLLFGFLPSPIPELVVLTFSCVIVISFIHFLK